MSLMSERRFVSQFGHQEPIDQVFLASDKQLRPNRNGNLYLQLDLSDRSGSIGARMWNASEQDFRAFENGDYVRIAGNTQLFQGSLQLIVTGIAQANPDQVSPDDFETLSAREIDRLAARLAEHLRRIANPHLAALAEAYLMDQEFMRKFSKAPAGVKNHHAYVGGLVEHVVSLLDLIGRIDGQYPDLDADLLRIGAFLHDAGKTEELAYEREFAYTDEGQLLGHVLIGLAQLDEKLPQAEALSGEPLPKETVLRIKHMIASHHGQYEVGSPKLPMTLEAVALHLLDNLDAKLHSFRQLMRDDPNLGSGWTTYHPNLGRKLFKGERKQ